MAPFASSPACWWCRQNPATTGEHKFKRSDLAREHGRGELVGDRQLAHFGGERSRYLRSTRAKPLKFRPSLCEECNSTRSQPMDNAYDRLIDWILSHEEAVIAARAIDLEAALGPGWPDASLNVLRFWGKHIGCRLFENDPDHFYERLPEGLIPFLNGGSFPQGFSFELWVEPAWLRFCDHGSSDPLWVRNLNYEHLYGPRDPGTDGCTQSIWRYGWLTMGWRFGGDTETHNPFERTPAPLPIRAQASADLELLWGSLGFVGADASDEDAARKLKGITGGGPIDPDQTLSESPIAEALAGGMLDFEAALRGRQPDRRDPPTAEADIDLEAARAILAVETALRIWGEGSLSVEGVRSVSAPHQIDIDQLQGTVGALEGMAQQAEGMEAIAARCAQMAALKLVEAESIGYHFEVTDQAVDGQEALLEAADLAGRAAAAAGLAAGDLEQLWDSMSAVRARLARLSAAVSG